MRIGSYDCDVVTTGMFKLDGGAMFGSVPKALWNKLNPADEQNRIALSTRSLLLRGDGRVILVDLGVGTKFGEKEREIFAVDQSRYSLDGELARLGLTRADVTDCILTHLHFDHAGGATEIPAAGGDATIVPSNARFHLQQRNLDAAQDPNSRERASYLPDIVGPVAKLAEPKRLELYADKDFDLPRDVLPGIRVRVSNGHTLGMQVVEVLRDDGSLGLLYAADLVPTAAHIKLPFCMGYDLCVRELMLEKQAAFDRVIDDGAILFLEHDPALVACTLTRGKRHYEPAETYTELPAT